MTGLTDYSARGLLNFLTGQLPMPSLGNQFLALFTAVGADDGTGFTEVSGGSYARVQVGGSVATSTTAAAGQAVVTFSAVPAWVTAGMLAFDNTAAVIPAGTTVLSKTGTTVTLSANLTGGGAGSGDSISFSAFARSIGTGPSTITNAAAITMPAATGSWGTVIAFGLYDASSSGNLENWDYLGNFNWLPATVSSASPGILTAKAHGYSAADLIIFSTEYGGTAPSFSASNFTGQLAVVSPATDSFSVTNAATAVNTSSTGSGMVRKISPQSVPSGVTASFAASALTLQAA